MTFNAILTQVVLWGLLAIAVAIALLGAWVLIAKWRKGSLAVSLDQPDYRLGQVIEGELRIKARQAIDYQAITITLTCSEITRVRQQDGSDDQHVTVLYEDCQKLAGQGQIQSKRELPLAFRISLPGHLGERPGLGPIELGKELGKELPPALAAAGKLLLRSRHPPTVEWSIRALVEARGVDLSKTLLLSVEA